MREFAVLFISLALLALEYYLGTRRKPLLGALLPGGMPPACFQVFHVPRDWPPPG